MKILARGFTFVLLIIGIRSYAFECDSWPYEGIPYFYAKMDTLVLYSAPSLSSHFIGPIGIGSGSIVTFPYGVKDMLKRRKESEKRRQEAAVIAAKSGDAHSLSIAGLLNMTGQRNQNEVITRPVSLTDKRPINTEIMFNKSIQRTIEPGRTKATRNGKFRVTESYGHISSCAEIDKERIEYDKEYSIQKGDTLEYLLYLGENFCLFRFHGDVFMDHGCLGYLNEAFEPDQYVEREYARQFKAGSDHKAEWWISVKKNDKELGWTIIDKNNKMLEMIDTLK